MSLMFLHGKHYYIQFPTKEMRDKVLDFIGKQEEFLNDEFFLIFDNKPVIWTRATCGEFRGKKLQAWERVKRYAYKLKREA